MDRKYFLKESTKVPKLSRLIAKAIDLFLVLIVSIFFYPLGLLPSLIFVALSDALPNGQSVGKKFMGFSVISLEDGSPCSKKQSFIRNLPIFIPLGFTLIPPWGIIIGVFLGVPLIILEVYLLVKLDTGHRLGDVMADTSVVASSGSLYPSKGPRKSWFETANEFNSSLNNSVDSQN